MATQHGDRPPIMRGPVGIRGTVGFAEKDAAEALERTEGIEGLLQLEEFVLDNKRKGFRKLNLSEDDNWLWAFLGIKQRRRRSKWKKGGRGGGGRGRRRRRRRRRKKRRRNRNTSPQQEVNTREWELVQQRVERELPALGIYSEAAGYSSDQDLADRGAGRQAGEGSGLGVTFGDIVSSHIRPPFLAAARRAILTPPDPIDLRIRRLVDQLETPGGRRLRLSPGGLAVSTIDALLGGVGRFVENIEEITIGDKYLYIDPYYETFRYGVLKPALKDAVDAGLATARNLKELDEYGLPAGTDDFKHRVRQAFTSKARQVYQRATHPDAVEELIRLALVDDPDGRTARRLLASARSYESAALSWGEHLGPNRLQHIAGGAFGQFVHAITRSATYLANLPLRFNRGSVLTEALPYLQNAFQLERYGIHSKETIAAFMEQSNALILTTTGDVYSLYPGSDRWNRGAALHLDHVSARTWSWAEWGFRRRSEIAVGRIQAIHFNVSAPIGEQLLNKNLVPGADISVTDYLAEERAGNLIASPETAADEIADQITATKRALIRTDTGEVVEVKADGSTRTVQESAFRSTGNATHYLILDEHDLSSTEWKRISTNPPDPTTTPETELALEDSRQGTLDKLYDDPVNFTDAKAIDLSPWEARHLLYEKATAWYGDWPTASKKLYGWARKYGADDIRDLTMNDPDNTQALIDWMDRKLKVEKKAPATDVQTAPGPGQETRHPLDAAPQQMSGEQRRAALYKAVTGREMTPWQQLDQITIAKPAQPTPLEDLHAVALEHFKDADIANTQLNDWARHLGVEEVAQLNERQIDNLTAWLFQTTKPQAPVTAAAGISPAILLDQMVIRTEELVEDAGRIVKELDNAIAATSTQQQMGTARRIVKTALNEAETRVQQAAGIASALRETDLHSAQGVIQNAFQNVEASRRAVDAIATGAVVAMGELEEVEREWSKGFPAGTKESIATRDVADKVTSAKLNVEVIIEQISATDDFIIETKEIYIAHRSGVKTNRVENNLAIQTAFEDAEAVDLLTPRDPVTPANAAAKQEAIISEAERRRFKTASGRELELSTDELALLHTEDTAQDLFDRGGLRPYQPERSIMDVESGLVIEVAETDMLGEPRQIKVLTPQQSAVHIAARAEIHKMVLGQYQDPLEAERLQIQDEIADRAEELENILKNGMTDEQRMMFAHPTEAGKLEGTVAWFNDDMGYGFVHADTGPDILIHYNDLQQTGYRTLNRGDQIRYHRTEGDNGPQAFQVVKLEDAPTPNEAEIIENIIYDINEKFEHMAHIEEVIHWDAEIARAAVETAGPGTTTNLRELHKLNATLAAKPTPAADVRPEQPTVEQWLSTHVGELNAPIEPITVEEQNLFDRAENIIARHGPGAPENIANIQQQGRIFFYHGSPYTEEIKEFNLQATNVGLPGTEGGDPNKTLAKQPALWMHREATKTERYVTANREFDAPQDPSLQGYLYEISVPSDVRILTNVPVWDVEKALELEPQVIEVIRANVGPEWMVLDDSIIEIEQALAIAPIPGAEESDDAEIEMPESIPHEEVRYHIEIIEETFHLDEVDDLAFHEDMNDFSYEAAERQRLLLETETSKSNAALRKITYRVVDEEGLTVVPERTTLVSNKGWAYTRTAEEIIFDEVYVRITESQEDLHISWQQDPEKKVIEGKRILKHPQDKYAENPYVRDWQNIQWEETDADPEYWDEGDPLRVVDAAETRTKLWQRRAEPTTGPITLYRGTPLEDPMAFQSYGYGYDKRPHLYATPDLALAESYMHGLDMGTGKPRETGAGRVHKLEIKEGARILTGISHLEGDASQVDAALAANTDAQLAVIWREFNGQKGYTFLVLDTSIITSAEAITPAAAHDQGIIEAPGPAGRIGHEVRADNPDLDPSASSASSPITTPSGYMVDTGKKKIYTQTLADATYEARHWSDRLKKAAIIKTADGTRQIAGITEGLFKVISFNDGNIDPHPTGKELATIQAASDKYDTRRSTHGPTKTITATIVITADRVATDALGDYRQIEYFITTQGKDLFGFDTSGRTEIKQMPQYQGPLQIQLAIPIDEIRKGLLETFIASIGGKNITHPNGAPGEVQTDLPTRLPELRGKIIANPVGTTNPLVAAPGGSFDQGAVEEPFDAPRMGTDAPATTIDTDPDAGEVTGRRVRQPVEVAQSAPVDDINMAFANAAIADSDQIPLDLQVAPAEPVDDINMAFANAAITDSDQIPLDLQVAPAEPIDDINMAFANAAIADSDQIPLDLQVAPAEPVDELITDFAEGRFTPKEKPALLQPHWPVLPDANALDHLFPPYTASGIAADFLITASEGYGNIGGRIAKAATRAGTALDSALPKIITTPARKVGTTAWNLAASPALDVLDLIELPALIGLAERYQWNKQQKYANEMLQMMKAHEDGTLHYLVRMGTFSSTATKDFLQFQVGARMDTGATPSIVKFYTDMMNLPQLEATGSISFDMENMKRPAEDEYFNFGPLALSVDPNQQIHTDVGLHGWMAQTTTVDTPIFGQALQGLINLYKGIVKAIPGPAEYTDAARYPGLGKSSNVPIPHPWGAVTERDPFGVNFDPQNPPSIWGYFIDQLHPQTRITPDLFKNGRIPNRFHPMSEPDDLIPNLLVPTARNYMAELAPRYFGNDSTFLDPTTHPGVPYTVQDIIDDAEADYQAQQGIDAYRRTRLAPQNVDPIGAIVSERLQGSTLTRAQVLHYLAQADEEKPAAGFGLTQRMLDLALALSLIAGPGAEGPEDSPHWLEQNLSRLQGEGNARPFGDAPGRGFTYNQLATTDMSKVHELIADSLGDQPREVGGDPLNNQIALALEGTNLTDAQSALLGTNDTIDQYRENNTKLRAILKNNPLVVNALVERYGEEAVKMVLQSELPIEMAAHGGFHEVGGTGRGVVSPTTYEDLARRVDKMISDAEALHFHEQYFTTPFAERARRAKVVNILDGDTVEIVWLDEPLEESTEITRWRPTPFFMGPAFNPTRIPLEWTTKTQATTIRLQDIDTAESFNALEPGAIEATKYLKDKLEGQIVNIETSGEDKYGRQLGYIWRISDQGEGSGLVNKELVDAGLAETKDYGHGGGVYWNYMNDIAGEMVDVDDVPAKGEWSERTGFKHLVLDSAIKQQSNKPHDAVRIDLGGMYLIKMTDTDTGEIVLGYARYLYIGEQRSGQLTTPVNPRPSGQFNISRDNISIAEIAYRPWDTGEETTIITAAEVTAAPATHEDWGALAEPGDPSRWEGREDIPVQNEVFIPADFLRSSNPNDNNLRIITIENEKGQKKSLAVEQYHRHDQQFVFNLVYGTPAPRINVIDLSYEQPEEDWRDTLPLTGGHDPRDRSHLPGPPAPLTPLNLQYDVNRPDELFELLDSQLGRSPITATPPPPPDQPTLASGLPAPGHESYDTLTPEMLEQAQAEQKQAFSETLALWAGLLAGTMLYTSTQKGGREFQQAHTALSQAGTDIEDRQHTKKGKIVGLVTGNIWLIDFGDGPEKVQLRDLDTPNTGTEQGNRTGEQWYATEAVAYAKKLIGQEVYVELGPTIAKGRRLGYVWDDSRVTMYNADMARRGLGTNRATGSYKKRYIGPGPYYNHIKKSVDSAKERGAGQWPGAPDDWEPSIPGKTTEPKDPDEIPLENAYPLLNTGATNVFAAEVIKAEDGGNLLIRYAYGLQESVRLVGIGAPSLEAPLGSRNYYDAISAYAANSRLKGHKILVEIHGTLDNGQTLAYIWVSQGGKWVLHQDTLVSAGLTRSSTIMGHEGAHYEFLEQQEKVSKAHEYGIHGESDAVDILRASGRVTELDPTEALDEVEKLIADAGSSDYQYVEEQRDRDRARRPRRPQNIEEQQRERLRIYTHKQMQEGTAEDEQVSDDSTVVTATDRADAGTLHISDIIAALDQPYPGMAGHATAKSQLQKEQERRAARELADATEEQRDSLRLAQEEAIKKAEREREREFNERGVDSQNSNTRGTRTKGRRTRGTRGTRHERFDPFTETKFGQYQRALETGLLATEPGSKQWQTIQKELRKLQTYRPN